MSDLKRASKLWTLVVLVNIAASLPAFADNRCQADLGRVDKNFCLSNQHGAVGAAPRPYAWKVNDQVFDLSSNVCLTDGSAAGTRRDLVLALDRSHGVSVLDTQQRKIGADQVTTARYIIDKLHAEALTNPSGAPKISLVLFSSAPDCRAFAGTTLSVNREFPCVFVPARSIADDAQVEALKALLTAADGKFSQGGLTRSGDYTVLSTLLTSDGVLMQPSPGAGLLLFSDGRSYSGDSGDPYASLRSANYVTAETAARTAFALPAMTRYRTVFALSPVLDPVFGAVNADAYDTMCATTGAAAVDCNSAVRLSDPKTWPANRIDAHAYAASLVALSGGSVKDVIPLATKDAIDVGLETLRRTAAQALPIDAVAVTINGGARVPGLVQGGRIIVGNLPVASNLALALILTSAGREYNVPLTVGLNAVAYDQQDLADGEMLCKADTVAVASAEPRVHLADLQGGSGSCGVVSGLDGEHVASPGMLALMMALPALAIFWRRVASGRALARVLPLLAVALVVGASSAAAEEAKGLNVLQYRPVVDGVGSTEKALTIAPGAFNGGVFVDYANDSIELGGDGGKRLKSVVDNLVTTHATFNLGIHDRVALGADLPYVQKADEQRDVQGKEIQGGQLGRPADSTLFVKISIARKNAYTFGVMPIVTLPTGKPELLIGDGSANYGALFLLSGVSGRTSWAANSGYLQHSKPLVLSDDRANPVTVRGQILNFAGAEYRLSSLLSFAGNVQVKLSAGDKIDFTRSNPAEWTASGKLRPLPSLELQGGLGTGIGKGLGSPDYRAFVGATFVPDAAATGASAHRSVAARR